MSSRPDPAATASRPAVPGVLWLAAAFVAVEALVMVGLGVAEIASFSTERIELGVTTTLFFLAYGAGLAVCAYGLTRPWPSVRAPVVLAQLLQLLTAWSFRGGETTPVALGGAGVAVAVLVLVLLPASTLVLAPDDD